MPHLRKRHLEPVLRKLMGLSPIVGVLGHRQVGKTTLIESLAKTYHTMDDGAELLDAQKSAKNYVKERAGDQVAIDECQQVPSLFPALKEWVRLHKRPGQFILSGSVRFTSRKAIQESLTGRIINLELLPMLLSELRSEELPDFWRKAVTSSTFTRDGHTRIRRKANTDIERYFECGGLPGICFIRDANFRQRKLDTQIETILDRDLRKVYPTNIPYPQLRRLLQVFANLQGEPFAWTDVRRETDISVPTLKNLVYALEAVFLVRPLLLEGDIKGSVYYFEDIGELNFLQDRSSSLSAKIIHLLNVHIRGELSYGSSAPFRLFQFRTRGGVCVPLVLQIKDDFLGVIALEGETPTRTEMAAADSLLKHYMKSKIVMVHMGQSTERVGDRKLIAPLAHTI